jgi:hypothetical protein
VSCLNDAGEGLQFVVNHNILIGEHQIESLRRFKLAKGWISGCAEEPPGLTDVSRDENSERTDHILWTEFSISL